MRYPVTFLAAALGLAACGGGSSSGSAGEPFATPTENRVFVEVDNQNFNRATIWYQTLGRRQRLGVVEGKTTETLTIRNWPVAAPISLEIQLTASERCTTPELNADPGDHLYLQVPINGVGATC